MKLLGRVALFISLAPYFKYLGQDQIIFSKYFWFARQKVSVRLFNSAV